MKNKKLLTVATAFMLVMSMGMAATTDTSGLEHVVPEPNGSVTLSDAGDTVELTTEVSTDAVGGTTLQDGDTISDMRFKINDSNGDSFTVSTFNVSDAEDYSDGVAVEDTSAFTVGTDVPVDSTAEVVTTINKSQLTDNNVTLGEDSTLTFESRYNVTGTMEYERSEFNVYESVGTAIMNLVLLVIPVFVILMVMREFKSEL